MYDLILKNAYHNFVSLVILNETMIFVYFI